MNYTFSCENVLFKTKLIRGFYEILVKNYVSKIYNFYSDGATYPLRVRLLGIVSPEKYTDKLF